MDRFLQAITGDLGCLLDTKIEPVVDYLIELRRWSVSLLLHLLLHLLVNRLGALKGVLAVESLLLLDLRDLVVVLLLELVGLLLMELALLLGLLELQPHGVEPVAKLCDNCLEL